jgi:hypothetical protein
MHSLAFALMLTIRLYASGDAPSPDLGSVRQTTDAILQQALVEVEWTDCRTHPKKPRPLTCERPLQQSEVVVRLVSAVNGPTEGDRVGDALGDAVVDTNSGRGSLGTVYLDRVKRLALSTRTSESELLGRVIAHEVGHLLLGSTAHAPAGVMRPTWSRALLARRASGDWAFSSDY